jgi:hypothetical protein
MELAGKEHKKSERDGRDERETAANDRGSGGGDLRPHLRPDLVKEIENGVDVGFQGGHTQQDRVNDPSTYFNSGSVAQIVGRF